MEIRQFRVVVRVSSFERGLKFYGDALALPKIQSWSAFTDQRGVVFLAGLLPDRDAWPAGRRGPPPRRRAAIRN